LKLTVAARQIDNNSTALAPTFQALNELALLVGQVIQIEGITHASREVKHAAADLYCDLIRLVGDIAVFYRKQIGGLTHGHGSVSIKFDVQFGKQMTNIWGHKAEIVRRMWELKLGKESDGVDKLRQQLNGRHSVASSYYGEISNSMSRAEDTCEWLKSYLIEFFRSQDKVFTITGPSGTGKTVLSRWIKERLQRPIADEEYFTLFYSFRKLFACQACNGTPLTRVAAFDSPEDATCLAFLKSVLFQLLERNVGDVHLYEKLVASFTEFSKTKDQQKLEASLWTALDVGLRTIDDHGRQLVLIVDGVEEVQGPSPLDFHQKLRSHVAKFESIRAITFSNHISHISQGCKHLLITQKYIGDDIRCFLRQCMVHIPAYTSLGQAAQDRLVEDLTQKAKDSFLWANLAANLLAKESTSDSLLKVAQSLSDIHDIVNKLVLKLPLKTGSTRRLLSYMLVARRPLTVGETSELLRINPEKKQLGPAVDVAHEFAHLVGGLGTLRDGTIHFKSRSIREHMLGLMGKSLPSLSDAQSHFTVALLLYAKLTLDQGYEPSFNGLDYGVVDDCFGSHPLLEYATRHWIVHFRSSGMCSKEGPVTLSGEFKEVFPDSAFFAQLERACWHDRVEHYELALKIREGCFRDKGVSVLQSLIILGNLHLTKDAVSGAKYFYRAANVSQIVLSRSSTVTMTCTSKFLQITETMTFTCRTEIVTWRIQMIEFMIEVTKTAKGPHCNAVIRWYELLATLYVSIHEHHNATLTYKLIYEIVVIIEGKHSPRARKILDTFGGLDITLKGEGEKRGGELEGFLLDTCDGLDIYASTSIEIRLRLALVYIAQKKWVLAEEIFITLWRSISIACRIKATWELHIAKLRVAIEYIKFLRELRRVEEALSILTIVWTEYEHHSYEDITIILRIRELGELFKCFGMFEIAVSVFSKVWAWFKSKGKTTHDDAQQTTVLIAEVVEEITTVTTRTRTTTTTTTEVTETVVRDVYETHYHRCRGGKVDDSFFRSCFALIKLYQCLGNWSQAEIIIKQTLEITWRAILSTDVTIRLCEHHVTEVIRIATSLAICYHRQRMFEKAEHIYLRLWHACFGSLDLDHPCLQETLTILIAFYEEHHRHEKVIEVYIEVLERYRKHFGHGHTRTIDILYLLAGHCRMLGHKDEFKYYIEIVTVLNKGHKHCHPLARKAAVLLLEYYYEHKCFTELQHLCISLWEAFIHHYKEIAFEEYEIEILYKRYVHVLEFHAMVEFSVLYKLSNEYRTHVLVVFGAAAAIVLKALIAFGGICEREQKHHHECVTVYEEVIKRTTTTKTTTTTLTETEITTVKTRLSTVYVTIITSGGQTTTGTFDRCIHVLLEVYAEFKLRLGCWHEKTLGKLHEIIIIYKRIGTSECRHKMLTILQSAFVSIVTASVSSLVLYTAATTLASIYITAELVSYAEKLIADVQHLIIFGNSFVAREIPLKFDVEVKLTKVAFVFLTAFKQRLVKETVITYSEVLANLLLEMSLYEQYTAVVEASASIETILLHGAKLRFFWTECKNEHLVLTLDTKLFSLFKSRFSTFITHSDDAVIREFYLGLLLHLASGTNKVDFPTLACAAGNARVAALLEKGEFHRAHGVAHVVFTFCSKQRFYHDMKRVPYAYKLAELLAGINCPRAADGKLHTEMLKTSREIMALVLSVFQADGIDFARLQFRDLAGIIRLLGAQENFVALEPILHSLWHSREVREWDPTRVLSIGRLLVHVYAANNKLTSAIDLADRLTYNLQRSRGYLHPNALDMSQLLASLHASSGRADKSMSVYEDILRQIDATCTHSSSPSPKSPRSGRLSGLFSPRRSVSYGHKIHHHEAGETTTDPKVLATTATLQFELLKRAYLKQGSWTKPVKEFGDLYGRLNERLGKGSVSVGAPETWKVGEKGAGGDGLGVYARPKEWRLDLSEKKELKEPGGGWVCGGDMGGGGVMAAAVRA
jgi:tetratricopeptide (TPR) repeat protein